MFTYSEKSKHLPSSNPTPNIYHLGLRPSVFETADEFHVAATPRSSDSWQASGGWLDQLIKSMSCETMVCCDYMRFKEYPCVMAAHRFPQLRQMSCYDP